MIATGVKDQPADETDVRIMNMGVMAMAQALAAQQPDRAREYSKFSSERLGSYSYQKAAAQVAKGLETGIDLFDWAVRWFRLGGMVGTDPAIALQAEQV